MLNIMRRFGIEPGDTMASVLDRNRGIGPGFDFVRIGLAMLIFYMHCQWLGGAMPTHSATSVGAVGGIGAHIAAPVRHFDVQKPIHDMLVPMFFAVSGFLVTGSAMRTRKVGTFLWFRVLRLLPALVTEVTLSALVLGVALTTLPLTAYFTDHDFRSYFLNILGEVHFFLPGVFKDNGVDIVNVNLWTLPSEFYCYLITMVGMATTLIYRRNHVTVLVVLASILIIPASMIAGFGMPTYFKSPVELVYYFFVGVAFYHWRDRIPLRLPLFIGAFVAAYLLETLGGVAVYLVPVLVCYTILFIGMLAIPRMPLLQRGDYSYGVYLYGFPICQAWLALQPGLHNHSWRLFAVAFPSTLLFAILSWHGIEKPALRLKKAFATRIIPVGPKGRTGPPPPLEEVLQGASS